MSTTTFAEFYSVVSTSLQRNLLYHRTTILTSIFLTSLKFYVKNMHPVGCMFKIIFDLVKINLRNDRLQRFEGFWRCLVLQLLQQLLLPLQELREGRIRMA